MKQISLYRFQYLIQHIILLSTGIISFMTSIHMSYKNMQFTSLSHECVCLFVKIIIQFNQSKKFSEQYNLTISTHNIGIKHPIKKN